MIFAFAFIALVGMVNCGRALAQADEDKMPTTVDYESSPSDQSTEPDTSSSPSVLEGDNITAQLSPQTDLEEVYSPPAENSADSLEFAQLAPPHKRVYFGPGPAPAPAPQYAPEGQPSPLEDLVATNNVSSEESPSPSEGSPDAVSESPVPEDTPVSEGEFSPVETPASE